MKNIKEKENKGGNDMENIKEKEEGGIDMKNIKEKEEGGNNMEEYFETKAEKINKRLLDESIVPKVEVSKEQLRKTYPETHREEINNETNEWQNKMGDNMQYVKKLEALEEPEGIPYQFDKEGFSYFKKEVGFYKVLSNVLVIPLRIINIYDNENKKCFIELKAILKTGEELPTITIPIHELNSCNFYTNSEWGVKVQFKELAKKSYQNDCIRKLAENLEEETIFNFTGFYNTKKQNIFLHSRRSNRNR